MGWRDVEYKVVLSKDPRLLAVTQSIADLYTNGGVVLRVFEPTDISAFDFAARVDMNGLDHQLRCFLEAPSVRMVVPELQIPDTLTELPRRTWYGRFEFEGAITYLLLRGGAYKQPTFGEEVARQMSREFADALVGDPFQSTIWRIDEPWTDWFYDIAWDNTFVIAGIQTRRFCILCVTDTD